MRFDPETWDNIYDIPAELAPVIEELTTQNNEMKARLEHIDYCLDKWRHGAPAALAEYAAKRMRELDGVPEGED